ncbi:hypothetical protein D3C85_1539000 [compost metagenome]
MGGENTAEPGTRSSEGTFGNSLGSISRSAIVVYPVSFTKTANCALVTSCSSIQKPSSSTSCSGWASGKPASVEPMVNSPPSIHTIPPSLRIFFLSSESSVFWLPAPVQAERIEQINTGRIKLFIINIEL